MICDFVMDEKVLVNGINLDFIPYIGYSFLFSQEGIDVDFIVIDVFTRFIFNKDEPGQVTGKTVIRVAQNKIIEAEKPE